MNRAIIVAFIFGVVVTSALWIFGTQEKSFGVSGVSDRERWDDLNNNIARNRFCQKVGYQEGKLYDSNWGNPSVVTTAGNPYGYDIYCVRSVEEHQVYEYAQYKKWLLSLELTNKI